MIDNFALKIRRNEQNRRVLAPLGTKNDWFGDGGPKAFIGRKSRNLSGYFWNKKWKKLNDKEILRQERTKIYKNQRA